MKKVLSLTLVLFCISFLFANKKWNIRYYHEIEGKQAVIYADNEEWMPISTQFTFELENMVSTLTSGETVVIPAKSKRIEISRFSRINPNAANKFSYHMLTNFGNALQSEFDRDYIYWLPFEKGKTKLIFQGYDGKFSHQNAAALDFNLNTGDKVFVAREGTAVEVVSNNNRNCADISCAKFNNKILILHSDGTFADYAHLKFNGALINVGDKVEQGQLIGYSGNTGFSNGPHLHFSVFINRINGERTYIKTKFRTSEHDATFLEEKKSYTKNY